MTDTRDKTGTVKRDLHTARPLWADSARISPRTRSWPESREADVAIAGRPDKDADLLRLPD